MASPKQTAAVVVNPIKVDTAALRRHLRAAEEKFGWDRSLWFETTAEDPGVGQARQAVEQGADVVLVAGGDGTVRASAESLRGTGVPMALLPSGTGNLLARNLGVTLDHLEKSVMDAFHPSDRSIDVGVVESEREDGTRETNVFLVMAGVGLDAQMIVNTNDELKKRVGWLAYVDAIARSTRGDRSKVKLRFSIDGSPSKAMTAHMVLIGNCGSLPGNLLLLPDAKVDDGILDVVALRPKGLFGWVEIWMKISWENGLLRRSEVGRKFADSTSREVRTLRYNTGKSFVARFHRPEEFELDGDPFGKAVALRTTVDPLSLIIRMPENG